MPSQEVVVGRWISVELNVRQNSKACDTKLFLNFKEQNECCLPELGQIYRMPEFMWRLAPAWS